MRPRLAALLVLAAGLVVGSPADAEWTIDLYGGPSWTESTDLRATGRDDTGLDVDATIFDIRTDTGATFGFRAGYWLDPVPFLGFGMDFFYFGVHVPSQTRSGTGTLNAEIADKTISVDASGQARVPSVTLPGLAFSPELRLRVPLITSQAFPKGMVQPYLAVGPAWAFTVEGDSLDLVIGGKLGAGLSVSLLPFLALFTEYRYTFFPDFKATHRNVDYEADINTHNVVFGVSFRF
jgi:opacity protein-like surface antigen